MSKTEDLRGMSDDQLVLTLRETAEHLFKLRFQSETEKVEAPSEIGKAKKEIARIKTLIRERELKAAKAQSQ